MTSSARKPKGPRPPYSRTKNQVGITSEQEREPDYGSQGETIQINVPGHSVLEQISTDVVASSDSAETSAYIRSNDTHEFAQAVGSSDAHTSSVAQENDPSVARRNMMDCFEALLNTPYNVFIVDERAIQFPNTPCRLQESNTAVICLCMLSQQTLAQRYLHYLVNTVQGQQPIIMLCIDEGTPFATQEVFDAMRAFCKLGANDTILQRSRGRKLILDVVLVVQRCHGNKAQVLEDVQRKKEILDGEKFWPHCHDLVRGIPPVNDNRPHVAVGSCVASRLILSEVARGSFGKIFKCEKRSNGRLEALKVVHKSKLQGLAQVNAIAREISLMQMLNHPNVVKLHGAIHTCAHIILVMDLAGNISLYRYVKDRGVNFDNGLSGDLLRQIVAGLAHCHRVGVAHRALKTEHIMVMEGGSHSVSLKIVGFSCAVDSTRDCTDACGTPPFVAPEVFLIEPGAHYDPACIDMWACGVIFLELLCGLHKIDDLLQCRVSKLNKNTYAANMVSLFIKPRNVWEDIKHHISDSWRTSMPGGPKLPLFGMLHVSPTLRWSAEKAESWVRPWRCAF